MQAAGGPLGAGDLALDVHVGTGCAVQLSHRPPRWCDQVDLLSQRGGRFTGELAVELDGAPLLAHTLLLDGADPVLAGPVGTGGARTVGMLVVLGKAIGAPPYDAGEEPGLRWACSALNGPGWLLLALGDRYTDVSGLLDNAACYWSESKPIIE